MRLKRQDHMAPMANRAPQADGLPAAGAARLPITGVGVDAQGPHGPAGLAQG